MWARPVAGREGVGHGHRLHPEYEDHFPINDILRPMQEESFMERSSEGPPEPGRSMRLKCDGVGTGTCPSVTVSAQGTWKHAGQSTCGLSLKS